MLKLFLDRPYANARKNVKNLDTPIMIPKNQLSMVFIKRHTCNVTLHTVSKLPDWLANPSVPDPDHLSSDVELHANWTVVSADDGRVVRQFWGEGFGVFEYFEDSGSADEAAMFGHGGNAGHLVNIRNMESLDTRQLIYIPHLDHALGLTTHKVVPIDNRDTHQRRLMPVQLDNILFHIWVPHEDLEVKAT